MLFGLGIDTGGTYTDSGALEVDVDHKIEEVRVDVEGKGKRVFRGATVTVRASGKPMMHWFD